MSSPPSYQIIRRTPAHDTEIWPLFEEAFGATAAERSRARWQWQYVDNPNNDDAGPVVWIAVRGDRVLGQIATMPAPMWWGDREITASVGMDYFVRKGEQGRGIAIRLAKWWADHVDVALALGLTETSYAVFKRIFTDVGPVPAYLRAINATAIARRRLGVIGSIAGPIIGAGLFVMSRRFANADGLDVRAVTAFNDEYDDLWLRARGSYSSIIRRDAKYLRWKYLACPFRDYSVLEARSRGTLSGFAVIRREGNASFPRGVIADLFCDTRDAAVQDGLIAAAVDWCRRNRLVRVETSVFNGALGVACRRHGFRAGRTAIQYCIAHRHASSAPFSNRDAWSIMLGDGDLDRA